MKFKPIDLSNVKTYPLKERKNKVKVEQFAKSPKESATFKDFFDSFPQILAGKELREVVAVINNALQKNKPVIAAMGTHVIKCGLSPVIIELMKQGVITCVALNGAGAIHDVEIAMIGETSEDVDEGIKTGKFGMAKETGEFINGACSKGAKANLGLGAVLGKDILESGLPFREFSILATAAALDIPATVHVAVGTDIIHMHPNVDAGAIGLTSHTDFKLLASVFTRLGNGGVLINMGSAVLLPQVCEKAITVAKNLGYDLSGFTAVNLDFIRHYRPLQSLIRRAEVLGGKGYYLVGHHEIMIPLLANALIEVIRR